MPSDIPSIDDLEIEARLLRLLPAGPDADLLERLTAAAEGTATDLTDVEQADEAAFRHFRPAPLSGDFAARLQAVVAGAAFPLDEKIVLFPKGAPAVKRSGSFPRIAVAAAVAMMGAAAALLLPGGGGKGDVPPNVARDVPVASAPSEFVPANFNRGFSDARDQGVLWNGVDQPHRVVRIEYLDRATFVNGEGKTLELEQPKVEYILIPEEID
jgi:hypothetical protein